MTKNNGIEVDVFAITINEQGAQVATYSMRDSMRLWIESSRVNDAGADLFTYKDAEREILGI